MLLFQANQGQEEQKVPENNIAAQNTAAQISSSAQMQGSQPLQPNQPVYEIIDSGSESIGSQLVKVAKNQRGRDAARDGSVFSSRRPTEYVANSQRHNNYASTLRESPLAAHLNQERTHGHTGELPLRVSIELIKLASIQTRAEMETTTNQHGLMDTESWEYSNEETGQLPREAWLNAETAKLCLDRAQVIAEKFKSNRLQDVRKLVFADFMLQKIGRGKYIDIQGTSAVKRSIIADIDAANVSRPINSPVQQILNGHAQARLADQLQY